jgi:hypothetical protein
MKATDVKIPRNSIVTITRWKQNLFWESILVGQAKWVIHGKVIDAIGDTVRIEFPRRWYWPFYCKRKWYSFSDKHYRINVQNAAN